MIMIIIIVIMMTIMIISNAPKGNGIGATGSETWVWF